MKPPLSNAPLLPLLAALVGGIVAQHYLPTTWLIVVWVAIAVLAIFLSLRRHRYSGVLLGAVIAGGVLSLVHSPEGSPDPSGIYKGTVIRMSCATMSTRAVVKLSNGEHCYITIPGNKPQPSQGDIVTFSADLAAPRHAPLTRGDIDMRPFLYRNYITLSGVVSDIRIVGKSQSLRWRAARARERIEDLIIESSLNNNAQEFLCTIIAGDDSLMDDSRREIFSAAGLAHILALSGLHMAILAYLLGFVLLPLSYCGFPDIGRWFVIILLWAYAIVTGLSPSVTRAAVMITIALIGRIAGRNNSTFNSLCFAAILIIAFDPRAIYAPGFQLTMIAVASICAVLWVFPPISSPSAFKRTVASWLYVTVAATAGTALLVAFYFHRLPIYSILANIPTAFLLPPILCAGVVLVLFGWMGIACIPLTWLLNRMCDCIYHTADLVSSLPGSSIGHIYLPWWGVLAGYIALVAFVVAWRNRRPVWIASGIALFAAVPLSVAATRPPHIECFVTGTQEYSALVTACGNDVTAMTTAPEHLHKDVRSMIKKRFANFLGLHGTDSVRIVTHQAQRIGDVTLAIAGDTVPESHIDYLIIGKKFKGDILELAESIRPDTIILAPDVNARRRKRYERELREAGIPAKAGECVILL